MKQHLSNESELFIALLQGYSAYKNAYAADIYQLWKTMHIIDYIHSMYFQYHQEREQNAYEDIDRKLKEKGYGIG